MGSVTQITQILYDRDPRKCITHLCFYHYLKNAVDMAATVNTDLISEFIDDCFRFEHWQSQSAMLISDMNKLIGELAKQKVIDPSVLSELPQTSTQRLFIENETDFLTMLNNRLRQPDTAEFNVLPFFGSHKLVLCLLKDGGLRAEVYQPQAKIEAGGLKLLSPITRLCYDQKLDLMLEKTQKLALNGLQTLFFKNHSPGLIGRTLQGHLFKVVSQLETQHFSSYKEGFVALKEIERHFVEPSSDPYYQELVDLLEKSYHLLHRGRPEAHRLAPQALARGREALQTIYPKDKLLLLLVTNIEFLLRPTQKQVHSEQIPQENRAWQKAKPLPS